MLMSKNNWNDIKKYYLGTFVKFKETGDRIWKITSVLPHEVQAVDVSGFIVCIDLSEPYELDYIIPSRVLYQDGPYAKLLCRIPARQYSRGISAENTTILVLSEGGQWATGAMTMESLQGFVDKPCYQSLDNLTQDYYSHALNPYFAVSRNGNLFCTNVKIGELNFQNKTGKVKSPFRDDVSHLTYKFLISYDSCF